VSCGRAPICTSKPVTAGGHIVDQLMARPPYSDPDDSALIGGAPRLARSGAISVVHPRVFLCA
jgi:hypothetical protein